MTGSRLDSMATSALHCADERDEAIALQYGGERVHQLPAPDAKPKDVPRLAFVPIGQFLTQVTAPNWLIRNIVETDSLLLIFGDPEAGKSFLAMDWAASVATGREWNGCRVKQGPVLYINGEGHNGVNRRFHAWRIANQCDLAGAPLFLSTVTTALTDEMGRVELEAVIAEFIHTFGQPVLIVIDTLARNYGPGDENSTQDMTRAVATCDSIREMTRATVALVHHSGHADKTRARGSMVLRGALDAEYRMTRVDGGDTTFEATKMKDAAHPAPMCFRFAEVELGVKDEDGKEVTSAVLRRTEMPVEGEPKRGPGQPAGQGKHQTKALEVLCRLYAEHVTRVMRAGRDPSEAHVSLEIWRDNCLEAGIARNRFHEVQRSLVNTRKVSIDFGFATPLVDA